MAKNLDFICFLMDNLTQLRNKIDSIDDRLITLLAERFSLVLAIWAYKKMHQFPSLDLIRRENLLKNKLSKGIEKWLTESFIIEIRERIHKESLRIQK